MTFETFVKLGIAGTIITFIGTMLTLFFRDYFLANYFEKRKYAKALDDVFKKYKDPITLSALELSSRLAEIIEHYPTVYLTSETLKLNHTNFTINTIDDNHFKKHKFYSTVYRFNSFLGWLELYRQEITFLNGSNSLTNIKIENCLSNIRSVLADGQLNENEDWIAWTDFLIFREEQREIGENMILFSATPKNIIGYSKFKEQINDYVENGTNEWLSISVNFFIDLKLKKDFRLDRYYLLIQFLKEFLLTLGVDQNNEVIKKINRLKK